MKTKPKAPKAPPPAPAGPVALLPALLKQLKAKVDKADDIPPGTYPIRGRLTLDVDCMATQAQSTDARPVVPINPSRLVAGVLEQLGLHFEADRLNELVAGAFKRATEEPCEEPFRALAAQVEGTLDRCRALKAEMMERVPRAGTFTAPGTVDVVGWEPKG